MILRIDHVSIAVRDARNACDFLCRVLGAVAGPNSIDEEMKFLGSCFSLGDLSRIELVSPTEKGSFLDGFLKKGEGVHHIALQTGDIRKARERLDELGVPYFGYDEETGDWKELFIHPKDAFGVLIQIAQFNPDAFIDDSLKLPEGKRWQTEKTSEGVTLTLAHPGGGTFSMSLTQEEAEKLAADITRKGSS